MFDINPILQESELVKHIKQEANYSIKLQEEKGESIRKDDVERAASALLHLTKFTENYTDLRAIVNRMSDFLRFGVFSPLTLVEGEFIYKKPELAQNRRNPYVYKDLISVFYDNAYIIEVNEYYDANRDINYPKDTKEFDDIKPLYTGDLPRVYISKGGLFTNIYFDKAYLKDNHLKEGWYPKSAYKIRVLRIIVDNHYVDFCFFHDANFHSLMRDYKLHVVEDNNREIKHFVTTNIKKDALFSKGSTF